MSTGTYNFVSVILNIAVVGLITAATAGSASGPASLAALLLITQFLYQVKIRFMLQLINGISKNCLNALVAHKFQLLFLHCYLLIFQ